MEKLKTFWTWYKYSSFLVGVPILFVLIFFAFQKFIFTSTCMVVGVKCEYAFGADQALANYMGDLLAANPHVDIVAKRR